MMVCFPTLEHDEWLLYGNYCDVSLVDLHYPIKQSYTTQLLLSSVVKIHE